VTSTDGYAAAEWRKGSKSSHAGNCVEVAHLATGRYAVRDSKNRAAAVLTFSNEEWISFLSEIKEGRYGLLS
jgi:hypothetical protein